MGELDRENLWIPESVEEYAELHQEILSYPEDKRREWQAAYGEHCLFYLSRYILSTSNPHWLVQGRHALDHDLPFWFLHEIEQNEDNTLYLLSREHIKSTGSTFCRSFQIVIQSRGNATLAVISDTLKLSTKFCRRNKTEMEKNPLLHWLWPDIFYEYPKKQSDVWSLGQENPGLQVQRTINVPEATFTPVGLDSAIETGPHYEYRRYDDIVTRRNTRNESLMTKTKGNLKASHSLGKDGGHATYVGTTYHPLDAYNDLEQERGVRVIKRPCWMDAQQGNKVSVYYSMEYLLEKKELLGDEEFGIQWELNPRAGKIEQVQEEWVRYYDPYEEIPGFDNRQMPEHLARLGNTYMTVDGAGGEKDHTSDFTCIQVWSAQMDGTVALLDMVWDRLDPDERRKEAMRLYLAWAKYRFQDCRWEAYGMDSDIFWLSELQTKTGNHFTVHRVSGTQKGAKEKRIGGRLFPLFKERKVVLPEEMIRECAHLGGNTMDLIQPFVHQELLRWPLVEHDDILDCMSRLLEPNLPMVFPETAMMESRPRDPYARASELSKRNRNRSAMAPWGH